MGRSCSDENQPGSGTDIELWVAAMETSASGRSHSSRWPLHGPFGSAAVVVPPLARNPATTTATSTAATAAGSSRRRPGALSRSPSGSGSGSSGGGW